MKGGHSGGRPTSAKADHGGLPTRPAARASSRQVAGLPEESAATATRVDDELAAERLRAGLRDSPLRAIDPDELIRPLLEPSETVIARRRDVRVERHPEAGGNGEVAGELYVTSQRLVLIGSDAMSWMLQDVSEAVIVNERVMLVMTAGCGLSILADRPRELRVVIAAARAGRIGA